MVGGKRHESDAMAVFLGGQCPLEVRLEHAIRLVLVVVGAADEHAEIGSVIRHRRILPVDKVHRLFGYEEVRVVKIVVAEAWCNAIPFHQGVEARRAIAQGLVIRERRIGTRTEQRHHGLGFLE